MNKPIRVSWSSLRVHEECRQKSFLLRSGKRAAVSNTRNFLHGSVVDKIMRDWLDNPLHTPGQMIAMVEQAMVDVEAQSKEEGGIVRWRNAADRAQLREFCVELVRRLEPILREHVLPFPYEHGKWFKIPWRVPHPDLGLRPRLDDTPPVDIVLTGEMDLLVQDGGPVVWDLKGTADDQYWRKVLGQLIFYDFVIWVGERGVRTRKTGLIQPMCKEQVLEFVIDDAMRYGMGTRIIRYVHDVLAQENSCKEGTVGCNFCDVRHACVRYQQPSIDAFGDLGAGLRQAAEESP